MSPTICPMDVELPHDGITMRPPCPDCDRLETENLGKIPNTDRFAGKILSSPLDGGCLWRCGSCHLVFRWPAQTKQQLDRLYSAGSENTWETERSDRADWKLATSWLDELLPTGSTILDIGCFDGTFLEPLTERYKCLGIEIHPTARLRAEKRGISIIGSDFAHLSYDNSVVDCITAFDVIEHVHSPADFLTRCAELVSDDGWIIVATGNSAAASFRLMGSAYWYCTIPEHLAFISPQWCQQAAPRAGLRVIRHISFSHREPNQAKKAKELTANLLYKVAPRLFAWLRTHGFGDKDAQALPELALHPPIWMTARDHFITLFRKAPCK